MMIVDTSAWVDYFRGARSIFSELVDRALETAEASVTGLIVTEIVQGARNEREYGIIERLFQKVTTYYETSDIWFEAGRLSLKLSRLGANIKTVDMVIASMAIRHQLPLLTKDKDFALIARHVPLDLVRP